MSKAKQRNKNKPQTHNDAPRRVVDVGKRPDYHGNSRYIELGTPGVPFRHLINVDHISAMRFEEKFEEQEFPIPIPTDAKAGDIHTATEVRSVLVGFDVVITFAANNNVISFHDPQQAMNCYNALLDQIHAVGVPMTRLPRLELSPPESPVIEDVDGDLIGAAVNEALLPGEAELTEEDLAMLENPEFDESIEIEVEEQALKDTLEDPPETH